MVSSQKLAMVAALCATTFVGAIAHAQGEAEAETPAPTVSADETVVVRGMAPGTLRTMIEEAEESIYARFNEINSDDQFDIFCYQLVEIGSKMLRRRCLPNYWRDASAEMGEETLRGMQSGGGPAFNPQDAVNRAHYTGLLLAEEMQRLTRDDDELLSATVRLANLQQSLEVNDRVRRASKQTLDREVTPDRDAVGIASEAAAVFEVRMGRRPWNHELSSQTFAIARVYGEIRDLEVECGEQDMKLEHEVGVEWTLPEGWGACTLVVDAKRDTTFALYEFN